MATARQVVADAYVISGIVSAAGGQGDDGDQVVQGLRALNDMLSAWELLGIPLQHSALALTDTVLVPAKYLEGTKYNLAIRMCIEGGYPVPPNKQRIADEALAQMRAERLQFADLMDIDNALKPQYQSGRYFSGYDIDRGS